MLRVLADAILVRRIACVYSHGEMLNACAFVCVCVYLCMSWAYLGLVVRLTDGVRGGKNRCRLECWDFLHIFV